MNPTHDWSRLLFIFMFSWWRWVHTDEKSGSLFGNLVEVVRCQFFEPRRFNGRQIAHEQLGGVQHLTVNDPRTQI